MAASNANPHHVYINVPRILQQVSTVLGFFPSAWFCGMESKHDRKAVSLPRSKLEIKLHVLKLFNSNRIFTSRDVGCYTILYT